MAFRKKKTKTRPVAASLATDGSSVDALGGGGRAGDGKKEVDANYM